MALEIHFENKFRTLGVIPKAKVFGVNIAFLRINAKGLMIYHNKKSRFEKQIFCQSNRLYDFSAILFPPVTLDGDGFSDTLHTPVGTKHKYG